MLSLYARLHNIKWSGYDASHAACTGRCGDLQRQSYDVGAHVAFCSVTEFLVECELQCREWQIAPQGSLVAME